MNRHREKKVERFVIRKDLEKDFSDMLYHKRSILKTGMSAIGT